MLLIYEGILTVPQLGGGKSARVVMNRLTGRSKCFGFVEMGANEARAAIQALHGKEIDGRP